MSVSLTIYEQLGGNKFKLMTGSSFIQTSNSLIVILQPNKSGADHLKITLNRNDLYDLSFYRIVRDHGNLLTGETVIPVSDYNDVFAEDLQDVFERVTGMYTTLTEREKMKYKMVNN